MNKNKIDAEEMVITFSHAIDSLTDAEFEAMLSSVRSLRCKSDPVAEYLACTCIGRQGEEDTVAVVDSIAPSYYYEESSSIYFPNIKNLFLAA